MRVLEQARLLGRVPVRIVQLDNGLRVVLAQVGTKPIVAAQVWYGVGSADEVAGKTGIAHFLEHLMFKGTTRHPEGVFDRALERLGGDTNAATWLDWTYYKVKLPTAHLPRLLDLEADRMLSLVLGEEGFRAEKDVVKNERLLRVENDPNGYAEERFFLSFFGDHPYGQPTIGHLADIDGLSRDDVLEYYRRHYAPANAVLVLAGGFDEAAALAEVQETFGVLPGGVRRDRKRLLGLEARRAQERVDLELPVAQARLLVGYPSPRKFARESVVGSFVCDLLLGARSAPLHRRVVTEEELAVYASGWLGALHLPSMLQIEWLLSEPEVEGRVLEILAEEVQRLEAGEPSDDELEGARNRIRMSMLGVLQNAEAVAGLLGEMVTLHDSVDWYDRSEQVVGSITRKDIAAYARHYLDPSKRLLLLARPKGGEGEA
jgi:zinc protease